ncbi:MAG: hypothetical protein ACNS60_18925 [Candidatus Cyclobacteriaceae bacterium M2_1C_046]
MKLRFRKYFKLQHKKVSRQAKLITLLLVMILFSAAILIVNKEIIHHRIYKAVGNTLQEWVYKETDGLYHFRYDSLSVNTLREQVTLKNVQLEIDSMQLEKLSEKPRNIYLLHSPRLFLDITSIWNVIFENKLDLKNIRVDSPSMTIFNLSGKDTANLSMESGDLYLKLNQYLDEFKIEKFFLKSGDIIYKRVRGAEEREVTINDFDVYVDNLMVDAEKRTAGTDRVRVVLNEPSFMLADDIHKIQMDSLIVDSEYETIILNNVFVFPEYEKLKGSDLSEISLYNFNIPNIILKGINFSQAYQDNILEIDKILIPNPEIIIDTHKKENGAASKKGGNNSLPILLSTLFNRISTNQLLISDASMDLAIESNNKLRNLQVKNTNLSITGLDLDTIKYSKKNNHINYTQIDLELEDYQLILPDSIHLLKANRIAYNSDSTDLKISGIDVYPKDPINAEDTINKFKVTIPNITLEGFHLMEYLQTHEVSLTSVNVTQPEVVFHNQTRSKDSIKTINFNIALPNEKLANRITSGEILIDEVKFTLLQDNQPIFYFDGGVLSFNDFLLTSTLPEKEKMFNSDDVKVLLASTKIYHDDFNNIEFSDFTGNLKDHSFAIKDLILQDSNERWELEGHNLKLGNFNIKEFLEAENLELDILTIEDVKVVYNKEVEKKSTSKETKQPFTLNHFKIGNGDLIVKDDKGMTSRITNIQGEIQNIAFNDSETKVGNVKLKTGQIEHSVADDNLQIGAMSANITSEDILLHLPYAKPIDYSLDNAVSVKASQISLLNYDLYLLLNEQKLLSDELKVLSTSFQIRNQNASQEKDTKDILKFNWDKILNGSLNEIQLGRVIVSGPELSLTVNDGAFSTADYQLELKNFDTSTDGDNYLLNSNGVRVKINALSYEKDDLKLTADQFNLDEKKKLITVNNLSAGNSSINFNAPLVFAKQLDLRKLTEEQKLVGNELELAGFKLNYIKPKAKDTQSDEDKDSDELPFISFDNITAHQGKIKLNLKEDQIYTISNVRGRLKDFNTRQHKGQLLYSESVDAKASEISGSFNDNNDKLIISGFDLKDSGKKITLNKVSLKPVHEKLKYAYQFGHETDWINLVLRKVTVSNLDVNTLLDENKLLINSISANSLDADVYRDKKLPEKEDKSTLLPQSALKKLDMKLNIDTFRIKNANLTYQELGEQSFEPGELNFNDLDIWITNITNIPSVIDTYNKLVVHTLGEIEGTKITTTASFDLTSENDEFLFSGTMGEGSLKKFNNILEKNTFLRIDKGHSKGLSFSLKADNDLAAGEMKFYYKSLKVSLLDKKTNKSSGLDESLASFFANTFVINSNNPSLFVLNEGNIYFKRDKSKSLFNYWAKSFLSGIVSSIGVKNNKKEAEEALEAQD